MNIKLDTVLVQSENFKLEDMDGEVLLYHVSSTRTLHLNSSAAIVWQLCDGERSVEAVLDLLKENYPDAGEDLKDDVLSALEELISNKVLAQAQIS
jgi:hypothetical protein